MAEKYPLHEVGLVNAHNHWRHRVVTALQWSNGDRLDINQPAVEAIVPYSEPGQYGPTIWFEVVNANATSEQSRHNGALVESVDFVEVPAAERTDSQ